MGANFDGLVAFDKGWKRIYTRLLKEVGPWERFEKKAPCGAHRKIVQIETGLLFVTAAKRALENDRRFGVPSFAKACAEATVEPHGIAYDQLSAEAKNRTTSCEYRSLQSTMAALVRFGLFDHIGRGIYRLTTCGEECYEYLENDNDADRDIFSVSNARWPSNGSGSAGWSNPQVVHSPKK